MAKELTQTAEELRTFNALGSLADEWMVHVDLRLAEPGLFIPADELVTRFLAHAIGLQDSQMLLRARKPAVRALGRAMVSRFGNDPVPQRKLTGRGAPKSKAKAYGVTADGWEQDMLSLLDENKVKQDIVSRKEAQAAARADPSDHRILELQPELIGGLSSVYTTELLGLACAPALIELKLYPDAKELTESFAVFSAVRNFLSEDFSPQDPEVTVVCVGDGVTPRTAALFAFRTKWQCIAVDPCMRVDTADSSWNNVARLQVRADLIEETAPINASKLLLVCVHAHVGLQQCLDVMSWSEALGVVVMPCCNFYGKLKFEGEEPIAEFDDRGVVSPHRLIRVYRRNHEDLCHPCI